MIARPPIHDGDQPVKITIYTTAICPFCIMAKRLLNSKGVQYEEIDVTFNPKERARMCERSAGRRTVPQIFIGERHIGGCDELHDLERQNRLDAILAGQA
ncbi:MAG: glutaredoxin 3 [Alphaproteobacteria bacterium]|nr:glutaredoxin 3 [Alphaproteobacteria bacterium]